MSICSLGMKTLKIALFGATGKTGIEFIKLSRLLEKTEVTAFVRNIDKLNSAFVELPKNLQVVEFDITGNTSWTKELEKCNVWVSIIGISGLFAARNPNQLYTKTANLLIKQAKIFNPSRVIVITSGGVVESPSEPWILKKVLKPFFLNPMYADMRVMEKLILESSMNFTIVRPPYLTNGKLKGEYRIILDDWFNDDKVLSRKDLAHFIIKQCQALDSKFNNRIVGISY